MIKIDLITGFLGSGKTTFIKKYVSYLIDRGYRIGILENDFGAINIDMLLLRELAGESCGLEMVSACCGNDPETHRRRFKTKLIALGMSGYDRVVIEPSGIFDVDEFFDVLHEEPLDSWYEIGNVIAIADARLEEDLSEEAEYVLATEIADAGKIVLSRTGAASSREIADTVAHLNRALARVKCPRRVSLREDILCKEWERLTTEDFQALSSCGCRNEIYVKQDYEEQGDFESLFFMNSRLTKGELREAAEGILKDPACGTVFRIKGFVPVGEDQWLELNATRQEVRITPIPVGQEVIILIGEKLKKDRIEKYLRRP